MRAFVLALLLLCPASASAQVIAGSALYFDHSAEDQAYVAQYQLCVDTVSDATCRDIGVTRVGTTDTLTFTVPSWVPRGTRPLLVRAVWTPPLTDTSAPTNPLTVLIVGGPARLRQQEMP